MKEKVTIKLKMRDLLCAALNEIVKNEKINMKDTNEVVIKGSFLVDIQGKKSKVSWCDVGYGEVIITIWWGIKPSCIDAPTAKPLNRNLKDALDVCCSGCLERKEGVWLQGFGGDSISETYCAKSAEQDLFSIPRIEPSGFRREGKVFL